MKGLILKDLMCLKKQLTTFVYVMAGTVVISILYVLSTRYGNLARVGEQLLDQNNGMSRVDVKNLGSEAMVLFMFLPIVCVGDLMNVFVADGKAGFYKVSSSLPVPLYKRVLARFLTIYTLFGLGVLVDALLAVLLCSMTDIMSLGQFLGVIFSGASILSIYSALMILYCVLLGYGREQYAQVLALLTMAAAFVIIKFDSVRFFVVHVLGDGVGFDSSVFWKPLDFIREKGYVLLGIAALVSVCSYLLSVRIAERKRGVI
ncbi:MAG: ABC-2 transporter permease [Lachnospiraceae bacterium]|nr:ABC-2 transporter permease [Lachnospiraceae bacterium]